MAKDIDINQLAGLYKRAGAAKEEYLKGVISNAVGEAAQAEAAFAEAADLQVRLQEPPLVSNLAAEGQIQMLVAEQLASASAAEAAVQTMQNFAAEALETTSTGKK